MTELQYREAIKIYTDADGLVCPVPTKEGERGASGNGLLYTSIHIINLFKNGWLKEDDKKEFVRIIDSCRSIRSGWVLNRSPVKTDLNSHDDYTGLAAAFKIIGMNFTAASMLRDFKQRNWFLDNEQPLYPRIRSWLGRMPQFVCHIYNCADSEPPKITNWLSDIQFKWQRLTMSDSSHDGWLLGYLKAVCSKTEAASKFLEKAKKRDLVKNALHNSIHPLGIAFIA